MERVVFTLSRSSRSGTTSTSEDGIFKVGTVRCRHLGSSEIDSWRDQIVIAAGNLIALDFGAAHPRSGSPLPVVVVVCDDSRTAPAYFDLLKRAVKQHVTLNIPRVGCQGGSPATVLDRAIAEHEKLRDDGGDRDAVWALIDMERDPACQRRAVDAKKKGEQRGIKVALSDPCYEVWTLLHLEDTGRQFNDCGQVLDRVKQLWQQQFGQQFDQKAQADYSKIVPLRHEAAARAKRHYEAEDQSRTEVYKIIEYIEPEGNRGQAERGGASDLSV